MGAFPFLRPSTIVKSPTFGLNSTFQYFFRQSIRNGIELFPSSLTEPQNHISFPHATAAKSCCCCFYRLFKDCNCIIVRKPVQQPSISFPSATTVENSRPVRLHQGRNSNKVHKLATLWCSANKDFLVFVGTNIPATVSCERGRRV